MPGPVELRSVSWWIVCGVLAQSTMLGHAAEADMDTDFTPVTCGSTVKLQHSATGYRVHSHDIKLGSGSGEQSVTAVSMSDDANSLWLIKGPDSNTVCPRGTPVKNGQHVRLQHLNTKKYLHTWAEHQAALSRQREVSAPADGSAWEIVVVDSSGIWQRGKDVLLKHVQTGAYLMAREDFDYNHQNCGQQCPIAGHLEVSTTVDINKFRQVVKFRSAEGVYWPRGRNPGTEIKVDSGGSARKHTPDDTEMQAAKDFISGSTWHWNKWRDVTFKKDGKFDAPTDDCKRGECTWSIGRKGEILIEWGEAGKHSVWLSSDRRSISGVRVKDKEKCSGTYVSKE